MTTTDEILHAVHHATGATPAEINADNRTNRIALARFLAMHLYHATHPWSSNQDAALAVGKRDPGTGRHGLMRAAYLLENDADFRRAYDAASRELGLQPAENQPLAAGEK
jgi:chromosomal replication initiation ATPase DnaA